MNQGEPVNPRSLPSGRSAALFHGSAIAAEMSGYVDIGMKREALRLARKVLEKHRILPEEFSETLRTIGIYVSFKTWKQRWKPTIEAAHNRQSLRFKRKVRSDMLGMYACLEEWETALKFVSVQKASSAVDVFHGMIVLLELQKLQAAQVLAARGKRALSKTTDQFEASLLIEALARFCARTHNWSSATELWRQAPLEEPFRENALSGIVQTHLARAYECVEIGLQKLAELKETPSNDNELCLPGNEMKLTRDAEKELLKFKRGIEKLLPAETRKELGITSPEDLKSAAS